MRKLYAVMLGSLAVFAFSVVAAESAFAGEWLENGSALTANQLADIEGKLVLSIDGLFTSTVECSGVFDGTVGPGGTGEITEVLNTAGEALGASLVGLSINCTVLAGNSCGASGGLAELWAEGLNWPASIELMAAGVEEFLGLLGSAAKPGAYEILCSGGTSDLCEGVPSAILSNPAGGTTVTAEFLNQKPAGDKCEIGEGLIEGSGLILLTSGATLTVS